MAESDGEELDTPVAKLVRGRRRAAERQAGPRRTGQRGSVREGGKDSGAAAAEIEDRGSVFVSPRGQFLMSLDNQSNLGRLTPIRGFGCQEATGFRTVRYIAESGRSHGRDSPGLAC